MELIRTSDTMTAGIVNTPLTKPAKLFFIPTLENLDKVQNVFNSFNIPYNVDYRNKKWFVISKHNVEAKIIKMIYRNYRTLKPKLNSDWKYLFWEIDNQDIQTLNYVLQVYATNNLPVYYHKSMRGYHFFSLKPITNDLWKSIIPKLRPTNLDYPPVTLRLKANKYVGELEIFREGNMQLFAPHSDTIAFKNLLEQQNIDKLRENYLVVFYPFPKQKEIVA